MAVFSVQFPDSFVARLLGPVSNHCTTMESHPIVQKVLAAWGEPDVAGLSAAKKAELSCILHLWTLANDAEVHAGMMAGISAAEDDAVDDFVP